MPNPVEVYSAVEVYLRQKGFSPSMDTSCQSGHPDAAQVLYFAVMIRQSACCASANNDCAKVNIETLLGHMCRIGVWDKVHHESALVAGGYAPDFVPWFEELDSP